MIDYGKDLGWIDCSLYFSVSLLVVLDAGDIFNSELVDVAPVFDGFLDRQVNDKFFVAVYYFSDLVAVSRHHVCYRQLLVHQNVMVQLCELLLLIKTQPPPTPSLETAVKGVCYHQLDV